MDSGQDEDLAAKGLAIFQRLRGGDEGAEGAEGHPGPPAGWDPAPPDVAVTADPEGTAADERAEDAPTQGAGPVSPEAARQEAPGVDPTPPDVAVGVAPPSSAPGAAAGVGGAVGRSEAADDGSTQVAGAPASPGTPGHGCEAGLLAGAAAATPSDAGAPLSEYVDSPGFGAGPPDGEAAGPDGARGADRPADVGAAAWAPAPTGASERDQQASPPPPPLDDPAVVGVQSPPPTAGQAEPTPETGSLAAPAGEAGPAPGPEAPPASDHRTERPPEAPTGHPAPPAAQPPAAGEPSGGSGPTPAAPPPPARPRRPLPRIMAVANQKGGVGKTTTAVNLGAALAELGYRVLIVDLDPQGNATTGLGVNARSLDTSVYDVLMREMPVEDVLEPTGVRNLFVVPATIDLAGAEIELVPTFSRELRLRRALQAIIGEFDYVLIDCPPSLGLLTINALAAAGEVVVPIQCEYYALEGLGQLMRNVQLVQSNLNADLELSTIVLTMYDARTKLADQVASEVRSHFGDIVCRHIVPRTVRLSEAPSYGQPIIVFDPTSRGAIAYRELAKEVSGGAPQRIG